MNIIAGIQMGIPFFPTKARILRAFRKPPI